MYQTLPWQSVVRVVAVLAVVWFGLLWIVMSPSGPAEYLRVLSGTLTLLILTILGFGLWGWRLLWKMIPRLNEWICPDLSGNWRVTLRSNIGRIGEHHPDLKGKELNSVVAANVEIRQNLFGFAIKLKSDTGYSSSRTTCVHLIRDHRDGGLSLAYMYENDTPEPLATDEQWHMGAARLSVDKQPDGGYRLDGVYWTNRNWTRAMNTAGRISMEK